MSVGGDGGVGAGLGLVGLTLGESGWWWCALVGVGGVVLRGWVLEVCVSIGVHMWGLVGVGVRWCSLVGGSLGSFCRVGALVATDVLGQISVGDRGCKLAPVGPGLRVGFISGRWVSETTDAGLGR